MDLGFGSLVEKFEEHFGARATRVLLGVVGLAAMTVCLKIVIVDAIIPTIGLLRGIGGDSAFYTALRIAIGSLGALVAALVSALVFSWLVKKKAEKLIEQSEKNIERAERVLEKVMKSYADVEQAYDDLIEVVREIEQETGKELLKGLPYQDTVKPGSRLASGNDDGN